MLLLNTYTAHHLDELFDGVYSIHWKSCCPADAAFPVTGSSLNSQLSSVPACQSIIKKAVVKRLMQGHRTTSLPRPARSIRSASCSARTSARSCWTPPATACTSAATAATPWRPPSVRRWPLPSPTWAASAATALWKTLLRSGTLLHRGRSEGHEHRPRPQAPLCRRALQLRACRHLGRAAPKGSADSKLDVGFEPSATTSTPPRGSGQRQRQAGRRGEALPLRGGRRGRFAARSEAIVPDKPPYASA